MSGALDGIRVLDLSRVLAGPWSTQILGDLGAEVIKVERPGKGDDTRGWGPPSIEIGEDSFSSYFLSCNRNKRSLALDIAKPEGAEIIRKLAAEADIVVENFKTGTLERYGLGYAHLKAINPGLIYCSITGFGQTGPYAARGGYDFLIQGMGGLMSVTGEGPDAPVKVGVPVIDLFTGLYATIAMQAALRHRDKTGEGQHIDCALLDTAVGILSNQAMNWLVSQKVPKPMGNAHPNVVPYRTFAAKDGHLIVAIGSDSQFAAFCDVLERPDLQAREEFDGNTGRNLNRVELEAELENEIGQRNSAELLAAMDVAGVPGGPINTIDAVFADAHVQARGMLQEFGGEEDPLSLVRFPPVMSGSPATLRRRPPALGADGRGVLTEMGLTEDQIESLAAAGIVQLGRTG